MPRVSVLMTIYNPGRFLSAAVDSVLCQTFPDFELIAVENGSDDGAKGIIMNYAVRDARIHLIDLPQNIGRTAALNVALEAARGEFVAVLDADDVAAPDRLALGVEMFNTHKGAVLLASHVHKVDANGSAIGQFEPPIAANALYDAFAYTNPIAHSASMFRRDAAIAVGGYPREYLFAQDLALWHKLIRRGNVLMIGRPLASIREHREQATLSETFFDIRYTERLDLFRKALNSGRFSAEASKLGSANLATLHDAFAKHMFRTRRPFSAIWQGLQAWLVAPGAMFRDYVGKSTRVASRLAQQIRGMP